MHRRLGTALLTLVLLTGCDGARRVGDGPADLTARAVAAVMLDHLSNDTSTREAARVDEHSPDGLVGAELWYPQGEEQRADHITVHVERGVDPGCVEGQCSDLGEDTTLSWQKVQIESDPGIVLVRHQRGDEVVTVLYSGPDISDDPRDLQLEPDVDVLAELARDPRLQLTTTASVVAAGERVDDWEGGEIDPDLLADVVNSDRTIVMSWIGGYAGLAWRGPSPYKHLLGPDAVGGRVRLGRDVLGTPTMLDVLAAPEPPSWLGRRCRPAGYRCDTVRRLTFIWRPARGEDPGDAFVWFVREGGETVGIHTSGPRLSDSAQPAAGRAGLHYFGSSLTEPQHDPRRLGHTTSRRIFEQFDEPGEGPETGVG